MLRSLTSLLVYSSTLTCPEFDQSMYRQHLTVAVASVGQHIMLHDGDQVCLLPSQPGEALTIRTSPGGSSLSVRDSANSSRYLSLHVFALLLLILCTTLASCTLALRSGKAYLCRQQVEHGATPASQQASKGHTSTAAAQASHSRIRPVILILVGVPGAGKSTFSAALQEACPDSWQRVNQARRCLALTLLKRLSSQEVCFMFGNSGICIMSLACSTREGAYPGHSGWEGAQRHACAVCCNC